MNFHLLKTKHLEARFLFLGDFNCYTPDNILLLSPQLRQLVHYVTHGERVLDLIITDMHVMYHSPVSSAYLLPNVPLEAAPSDHLGNLLVPRSVPGVRSSRVCRVITVRPMTESQLFAMGCWISSYPWNGLQSISDVDLESFT